MAKDIQAETGNPETPGAATPAPPPEAKPAIKKRMASLGKRGGSFYDPVTKFQLSGREEKELPARIPEKSLIPKWIRNGGLIVREV